MEKDDVRLSGIETLWSMVRLAHDSQSEAVQDAQQQLLDRYGNAVRRYLLGALRNPDAADDVFQEFAVRFVRGDFRNADPDRGKFRQFLKTSLYRLVVDYQRGQRKSHRQTDISQWLTDGHSQSEASIDRDFDRSWRDELLAKTWSMLKAEETKANKPYFLVLKIRTSQSELKSAELADRLTIELGRPIQPGNARILLHRARELFAESLLRIVEQSLVDPTQSRLEDELIALDLHDYCRPALQKRPRHPSSN